ncbi:MAG: hypothetical protein ACKOQM_15690 [Novosphingobium sp.]
MRLGLAVALFLLGGCGKGVPTEEQKRRDAADVAAVEAIQKIPPPIKLLQLQPITADEIAAKNLGGEGCSFGPDSAHPIALALVGRAMVKTDDQIDLLLSDSGGTKLASGAWEHYVGKEYTLTVKRAGGKATASVAASTEFPGELTVRDAWDRIIYSGLGTLNCGA